MMVITRGVPKQILDFFLGDLKSIKCDPTPIYSSFMLTFSFPNIYLIYKSIVLTVCCASHTVS